MTLCLTIKIIKMKNIFLGLGLFISFFTYSQTIKTETFTGRVKLNMNSGIYFVTLSNANNEKVIKKLVISK